MAFPFLFKKPQLPVSFFHSCATSVRGAATIHTEKVSFPKFVPVAAMAVSFFATTYASGNAQEVEPRVDTATQVATDIRTERFDDWTLRCVMPPAGRGNIATNPSCEIAQPLMVEHDNKSVEVLSLAISRATDKAGKADWALVVLTPLDVHLASDFGLGLGSAKPSLVRYRNCNHVGCFVIVPLDNNRISQMKQAADGAAFFRLLGGRAVKVSFSLKGFTKAFDTLTAGTVPTAKHTSTASGAESSGN